MIRCFRGKYYQDRKFRKFSSIFKREIFNPISDSILPRFEYFINCCVNNSLLQNKVALFYAFIKVFKYSILFELSNFLSR